MAQVLEPNPLRPVTVFVWQDIVLICDDGRGTTSDYAGLLTLGRALEAKYPNGFGVLIVIPRNAVPPSDDVREMINQTLSDLERSIRCMCWLIEGSGFQAAMVRAVLTGMRFLSRAPYARHISVDLVHALTWMLKQLESDGKRLSEIPRAAEFVRTKLDG